MASGISAEDNTKKLNNNNNKREKMFECAERRENGWENNPAKERCHGQWMFVLCSAPGCYHFDFIQIIL